ncbi:MAG: hypothetical protein JNM18_13140 [Planctomycetaceae bacterium]|nr:hypothetical protein [Planctomycetaceae bacterium]
MAKIGEGSWKAFWRQGLRELRATVYPESNVAQPAEYGMYGTKTPGEVAEDRRGDGRDLEEEQPQQRESVLGSRLQEAKSRDVENERGLDRDR